jgi:hypothetical protein
MLRLLFFLQSAAVAITNVSVVDTNRGVLISDQTVVIDSGRIQAVGNSRSTAVPKGARAVDGRGRYLIPGLWDMHVHLGKAGRSAPILLAVNGVTGVRDMGGSYEQVRAWRDSIDMGIMLGPRIVQTGPIIENAQWLNTVMRMLLQSGDTATHRTLSERIAVVSPEDAIAALTRSAALGVTTVKLRNDPPAAAYFTLLREAKRRGMRVVGHPPDRGPTLAQASDSGQASIDHLFLSYRNGNWGATLDAFTPDERADLFARFRRNGTAIVPTLIAGVGFRQLADSVAMVLIDDSLGLRDPRRRLISRELAEDWRNAIRMKQLEGPQPDWVELGRKAKAHLRPMADAGVMMLTGTDLGTPLTYPGYGLHDELRLLVSEGGLTPAQALRAATFAPAQHLGLEKEAGIIAAGARADLVLLNANPLTSIANISRINTVFLNGRMFDRATLDLMLAELAVLLQ